MEGTGGWRKLHKEESCALHFSPNTIIKIKSKRIRWAGHVGRVRLKLNAYILEDPKINDPVEEWTYPGTWYIALKRIRLDVMVRITLARSWL